MIIIIKGDKDNKYNKDNKNDKDDKDDKVIDVNTNIDKFIIYLYRLYNGWLILVSVTTLLYKYKKYNKKLKIKQINNFIK